MARVRHMRYARIHAFVRGAENRRFFGPLFRDN